MSVQYNPRIITDGLVLCLDAANSKSYPGSGTTVTSLVGTKTGALSASITYSSNNGGYFIIPNGTEQITLVKDSTILDFPGDFTIGAWFMLTSTPSATFPSAIFSSWNGAVGDADSRFIVYINSSGSINAELKGQSGSVTHQTTVTVNTWNNVTLVRASNTFRLYLNSIASTNSATSSTSLSPTLNTLIGNYTASNGNSIKGRISSFKVYNSRALSASEIKQNFNATKSRYGL